MGCLWLGDTCFNDDVFISEAKYDAIIHTEITGSVMMSIQNSSTEVKPALKPTLEPVTIHNQENSFSREVNKNGLVEEKETF